MFRMPSPICFVTSFCPLEKEYSAHSEMKQGYNIKRQKKLQKRKSEVISTHANILKNERKKSKRKLISSNSTSTKTQVSSFQAPKVT